MLSMDVFQGNQTMLHWSLGWYLSGRSQVWILMLSNRKASSCTILTQQMPTESFPAHDGAFCMWLLKLTMRPWYSPELRPGAQNMIQNKSCIWLQIAAVFEFAGALVLGRVVTNTIAGGIADINAFTRTPEIYAYGMVSLLWSCVWNSLKRLSHISWCRQAARMMRPF